MAFNINKVILLGNCTKVQELRYTPGNTAVLKFGLATNHSKKDGDGYKDVATFHNIVVYGKIAEWLAQNIVKGQTMTITGRIDNYSYEKDGAKRYGTQIVAEDVIPHRGKQNTQSQDDQGTPEAEDVADDVPF